MTYAYDGDGKRIKKDQTSGSTYDKLYWFGTGSDTLTETNLSGTATADFIFFGGKRTARLDVATGTIHYYFSDHLGSASVQNGAGIVSTFYYNTRLQPCRISVRSSGSAPADCADNAQTGNVLDFRYGFNLGTANNGNVASVENRRDTNRTQSFTYDHLSRLESAQTTSILWGNN